MDMEPEYIFSKRQIDFYVVSGQRLEVLERLRPIVRYGLAALKNLGPNVKWKPHEFGFVASILSRALHTLRDPSAGIDEFYAWFCQLHETSTTKNISAPHRRFLSYSVMSPARVSEPIVYVCMIDTADPATFEQYHTWLASKNAFTENFVKQIFNMKVRNVVTAYRLHKNNFKQYSKETVISCCSIVCRAAHEAVRKTKQSVFNHFVAHKFRFRLISC
jgi:hypothetical protein